MGRLKLRKEGTHATLTRNSLSSWPRSAAIDRRRNRSTSLTTQLVGGESATSQEMESQSKRLAVGILSRLHRAARTDIESLPLHPRNHIRRPLARPLVHPLASRSTRASSKGKHRAQALERRCSHGGSVTGGRQVTPQQRRSTRARARLAAQSPTAAGQAVRRSVESMAPATHTAVASISPLVSPFKTASAKMPPSWCEGEPASSCEGEPAYAFASHATCAATPSSVAPAASSAGLRPSSQQQAAGVAASVRLVTKWTLFASTQRFLVYPQTWTWAV
eukprot:6197838-Pleurochrysis_carterae.AAC.1